MDNILSMVYAWLKFLPWQSSFYHGRKKEQKVGEEKEEFDKSESAEKAKADLLKIEETKNEREKTEKENYSPDEYNVKIKFESEVKSIKYSHYEISYDITGYAWYRDEKKELKRAPKTYDIKEKDKKDSKGRNWHWKGYWTRVITFDVGSKFYEGNKNHEEKNEFFYKVYKKKVKAPKYIIRRYRHTTESEDEDRNGHYSMISKKSKETMHKNIDQLSKTTSFRQTFGSSQPFGTEDINTSHSRGSELRSSGGQHSRSGGFSRSSFSSSIKGGTSGSRSFSSSGNILNKSNNTKHYPGEETHTEEWRFKPKRRKNIHDIYEVEEISGSEEEEPPAPGKPIASTDKPEPPKPVPGEPKPEEPKTEEPKPEEPKPEEPKPEEPKPEEPKPEEPKPEEPKPEEPKPEEPKPEEPKPEEPKPEEPKPEEPKPEPKPEEPKPEEPKPEEPEEPKPEPEPEPEEPKPEEPKLEEPKPEEPEEPKPEPEPEPEPEEPKPEEPKPEEPKPEEPKPEPEPKEPKPEEPEEPKSEEPNLMF